MPSQESWGGFCQVSVFWDIATEILPLCYEQVQTNTHGKATWRSPCGKEPRLPWTSASIHRQSQTCANKPAEPKFRYVQVLRLRAVQLRHQTVTQRQVFFLLLPWLKESVSRIKSCFPQKVAGIHFVTVMLMKTALIFTFENQHMHILKIFSARIYSSKNMYLRTCGFVVWWQLQGSVLTHSHDADMHTYECVLEAQMAAGHGKFLHQHVKIIPMLWSSFPLHDWVVFQYVVLTSN